MPSHASIVAALACCSLVLATCAWPCAASASDGNDDGSLMDDVAFAFQGSFSEFEAHEDEQYSAGVGATQPAPSRSPPPPDSAIADDSTASAGAGAGDGAGDVKAHVGDSGSHMYYYDDATGAEVELERSDLAVEAPVRSCGEGGEACGPPSTPPPPAPKRRVMHSTRRPRGTQQGKAEPHGVISSSADGVASVSLSDAAVASEGSQPAEAATSQPTLPVPAAQVLPPPIPPTPPLPAPIPDDTTGAGMTGEEFYEGAMMEDVHTTFDYLVGVRQRRSHPDFQEVEIVALFQSRGGVAAVRAELEADVVTVGHDSLDAWPKWSQLGNTWRATGNVNRAIQCFRKALSIKPTDPDVLLNMAVVLQNLRYLGDAEILMREAVQLHNNGVLHHFILGNILQLQGRVEEAVASYEYALQLQPNFVPCEKKLEELQPHRLDYYGGDGDADGRWRSLVRRWFGYVLLCVSAWGAVGCWCAKAPPQPKQRPQKHRDGGGGGGGGSGGEHKGRGRGRRKRKG